MKKAIFLTAFNRPQYLKEVLDSWKKVRGLEEWDIFVQIEPNDFATEQEAMIYTAFSLHPSVEVVINPRVYGVLHNPWVGFEHLFMERNYSFVVRAEDDLIVSDDILEFFNFASEHFQNNTQVAAVVAYTDENGEDASDVRITEGFSPWVWGTWDDRWEGLLGPTWDHDYSTYNVQPGIQAGWDWNINTRIYPQHDLRSVTPTRSRVQNIGVYGTHAVPQDYHTTTSFDAERPEVDYRVLRE